jgi:hypothetical protein
MLSILKKLFYLALLVALGLGIWVGFAMWTGIYSVYSYPPTVENPNGATLLISRDAGEPMFNSPEAKKPPKKKPQKTTGIGFAAPTKSTRPVEIRTIVKLPYIKWAYEKSLEEPASEQ